MGTMKAKPLASKVMCVLGYTSLTLGKQYDVLCADEGYYTVRNDNGNEWVYRTEHFELVPEARRVTCVNDGGWSCLTKGRVYTVVDYKGEGLIVTIDNNGERGAFDAGRFVPYVEPEAKDLPILNTQVGGSHYSDMAIQPITYIMANGIGFSEGNVIKYVSRWRKKGGVDDLKKARHMLDLMIEHEDGK